MRDGSDLLWFALGLFIIPILLIVIFILSS